MTVEGMFGPAPHGERWRFIVTALYQPTVTSAYDYKTPQDAKADAEFFADVLAKRAQTSSR